MMADSADDKPLPYAQSAELRGHYLVSFLLSAALVVMLPRFWKRRV
jgi:hypothetical protein